MRMDSWIDQVVRCVKAALPERQICGANDDAVVETERRLGFALPETLRRFYLQLGETKEVLRAYHQFVDVSGLSVEEGAMSYCEDRHGGFQWGVSEPVAASDPPVM